MTFDRRSCGARIRELRKSKGMTQEAMASDLHISDTHLRKLEAGNRSASIELYIEIAQYFEVSLDELLLGRRGPGGPVKAELKDVIGRLMQLTEKL
ncbi:helix-turn-helix domain-containing protein [Lachnoclostridium sp. Marseille-P6806]|uniref:helix-turn-helix domain-containing protein n=1 Tax=Lachnoclostridium sp. Marseille-P6806 TaxID=2364793 RepID=UPI0013EF5044|nr:helix-turn-helix transcriptional regulator [Lachnoclostridium sp. Marseille-P6806]